MNQNHFARIPGPVIQRSVFDRSSEHKTTFDAGWLIPFYVDEALPGDTFNAKLSVFARLATPLKPIMDNMYMDFHFWAVAYRLIWDNWQAFNGEREDPVPDYNADVSYQIPHVAPYGMGGFSAGGIFDYMGIPVSVPGFTVCSLHMRAYNLIFNQWYRDQNLQAHAIVRKTDSGDVETDFPLRKRNKRHDYFTSALPWPQKGPSVDVPIGTIAPVYGTGYALGFTDTTQSTPLPTRYGTYHDAVGYVQADSGAFAAQVGDTVSPTTQPAHLKALGIIAKNQHNNAPESSGLYADLSDATAATINQLRQAFQIQKMFERDARGGTRYTEIITAHFGITSPDFRLQRAEFLGGGSIPININPVVQTTPQAATGVLTPQGNLAGFGIAAGSGIGFSKSFVEHCLLIGIVSVRANNTYQQGIPKMFTRLTREDFYWPSFAHLGEQPIYNFEIDVDLVPNDVFGYQERYAEYRYKPNIVSGLFRSSHPQSLDVWHLAQVLDSTYPAAGDAPPVLNEDFIMENPPIDRCIAVPSEPHFIFDSHLSLRCARPMPVYSVPGLIDHF